MTTNATAAGNQLKPTKPLETGDTDEPVIMMAATVPADDGVGAEGDLPTEPRGLE